MATFVINEWLWADSRGDNGHESQRIALTVIEMLACPSYRIIIITGSAFDTKAWKALKSDDTLTREIAKAFFYKLRIDSSRCITLQDSETAEIPDALATQTKGDDRYLLKALLSVQGAILVTSDGPLRKNVSAANLFCLSREQFLTEYL